jgi:hypothetical protein
MYDKDSVFMFVHVRSSGFHLDGFGRSSHEIKSCEDEEVQLHFSELRSSQLSPLQLWEHATSEKANGLAMNYGSAFTEGRCRKLCDGLFRDKSGLKVTEQYVGWVGHMFKAATVIFPEKQLPNPDPDSPAHSFPVRMQSDAPHIAASPSSQTAAQMASKPDTMLDPHWPQNNVIDESLAAEIQIEDALLASVLHTVSKAHPDRNDEEGSPTKMRVTSSTACPSTPTAAEVVTPGASSRK